MPERVFVTGASGFVGSAVAGELVARGYGVNALVHRSGLKTTAGDIRQIQGDLFDPRVLDEGMAGCEAVIHLVGIIAERPSRGVTFDRIHHQGTRAVVDACRRVGIQRYVHMSALGVRPGAISEYHRTKFLAEQYVRVSGLKWTILRPSMIHGPGGEFMQMVAKWARKKAPPFLFMPYFGKGLLGTHGAGRLQPVYVGDVARAFVDCLGNEKTIGEVYLLGGSEQITWPQLHRTAARAIVGRERWVLALPVWKALLLTRVVPAALLPFNRDQVLMSQEDNTCELTKFRADFGWEPAGFSESLRQYAGQL
jgi:nucleoside-diphosphate-sugar epimerase